MSSLELLAWQWVCFFKHQVQSCMETGRRRCSRPPISLSASPPALLDDICTVACAHTDCLFFSGNTNSIFALDYISGALTLNGPLDRENPFYSAGFILTVKVRPPPASRHTDRAGWGGHPAWGQLLHGRCANLGYVAPVGTQSCDVLFSSQAE